MDSVVLDSVTKVFRHRPALFNWIGREQPGKTCALDRVNLRVAPGEVLVLLGPNGSGKTTTLKLISTILLPDSGRVVVGGADTRTDPATARKQVGFAIASERSFFPRLSARENLNFFAALDDVPRKSRVRRIDAVLGHTGLFSSADMLVMKFSSGMYQRLAIARAQMKQPSVLLLDEPTRSLDPGSVTQFCELVRDLAFHGSTIVLATHSFEEAAAIGDRIAILDHGRIAGLRNFRFASAQDVRSFYFSCAGEVEKTEEPVLSAS